MLVELLNQMSFLRLYFATNKLVSFVLTSFWLTSFVQMT